MGSRISKQPPGSQPRNKVPARRRQRGFPTPVVGGVVAIAAVIVVGAIWLSSLGSAPPPPISTASTTVDGVVFASGWKGAPDAKVTITDYSDYQ